jgi:hypothetical protein
MQKLIEDYGTAIVYALGAGSLMAGFGIILQLLSQ